MGHLLVSGYQLEYRTPGFLVMFYNDDILFLLQAKALPLE